MAAGSKIMLLPETAGHGRQNSGRLVVPTARRNDSNAIARTWAFPERGVLEQATAEARQALEEAAVAAALAAQRVVTYMDVLEEALAILERAAHTPAAEAPDHLSADVVDLLSPREREVLALVAEGRSNKAIAEALYVSPNTIKTHVASLLSKLHVHTRVELAAMVARQAQR